MRGASDTRARVIGLLLVWAVVFAASFIVPLFIPPTNVGFLSGFNRVVWWFWLQVAAFVVAIALAISIHRGRAQISSQLAWTGRAPAILQGIEMLAIGALIMRIIY